MVECGGVVPSSHSRNATGNHAETRSVLLYFTSSFVHLALAFEDATTASMKAMPRTPSSILRIIEGRIVRRRVCAFLRSGRGWVRRSFCKCWRMLRGSLRDARAGCDRRTSRRLAEIALGGAIDLHRADRAISRAACLVLFGAIRGRLFRRRRGC